MADHLDHLKSLHTTVVDAKHGYEEALDDAKGMGLTPLFSSMAALHGQHAAALADKLRAAGEKADHKGSFLSTIHRTVISIRSLFGGLDESILPGLVDGERRVISYYDEAIKDSNSADNELLLKQRTSLAGKIAEMEILKASSAKA